MGNHLYPLFSLILLMSCPVLVWNSQGASGKPFLRHLKMLISFHHIKFMTISHLQSDLASSSRVWSASTLPRLHHSWTFFDFKTSCLICKHTPRVNGSIPDVTDATLDHERLSERFCSLYGSLSPTIRQSLWNDLELLSFTSQVPWFIAGDFNVLQHVSDKKGGSRPPSRVRPCLLSAYTTSIAVTVFLLACSVSVTTSRMTRSEEDLETAYRRYGLPS
ncbi:hypothetical protein Syun_021119 [Stephania yunnanensis]|uniref:Endonuclease/exonuclease/phosphatase domain-containing protein n=1 Tax=Stephania yunnanensis TaxID=152371 RepID=A0AAP0NNV3_9MAGN